MRGGKIDGDVLKGMGFFCGFFFFEVIKIFQS